MTNTNTNPLESAILQAFKYALSNKHSNVVVLVDYYRNVGSIFTEVSWLFKQHLCKTLERSVTFNNGSRVVITTGASPIKGMSITQLYCNSWINVNPDDVDYLTIPGICQQIVYY